MAISGDVRINQDGIVPTAFELGASGAVGLGVAVLDSTGSPLGGFDPSRPANSAHTGVTFATGSVAVLAANPARRGVMLFNSTNKPVNVFLGSGASATVFSFQLPTNGSYDGPMNGYTGQISAFWVGTASTGAALHATEITT